MTTARKKGRRQTAPSGNPDPGALLRDYCDAQGYLDALTAVKAVPADPRLFSGVTPESLGLLMVCLLSGKSDGSAFVLAADGQEAEDIFAVCRSVAPPGLTPLFFPAVERLTRRRSDAASLSARWRVCQLLLQENARLLVVAPCQAVLETVPGPDAFARGIRSLRNGDVLDPDEFLAELGAAGFQRLAKVERPGDFARRGGILDVFSYGCPYPVRLEFDDDRLESIREFDPVSQLSRRTLKTYDLVCVELDAGKAARDVQQTIMAYCGAHVSTAVWASDDVRDKGIRLGLHAGLTEKQAGKVTDQVVKSCGLRFSRYAQPETAHTFPFARTPPKGDSLESTFTLLKGHIALGGRHFIMCRNDGERDRMARLLGDYQVPLTDRVRLLTGDVSTGFMLTGHDVLLSGHEILNRGRVRRQSPVKRFEPSQAGFFAINPGDLVVHAAHGIGRFLGMEWVEKKGLTQEYLVLEYRDQVKLFVPVTKADLVAKYIGGGDSSPALDKLHGKSWLNRCAKVQQAVHDLASDLLEIQARRQSQPGFAFGEDEELQRQLEASFEFEDTPDQADAMKAIKRDMQSTRCMDRLLCGDVGYGKTEVAIRAAFKAVCSGKQVAVLVPTTVLAEQHFRTFSDRLSGFPVTVAVLSRFCGRKAQKATIAGLKNKTVDIVIGTHRLLSGDVGFHDLGLVIVDEEQRFGVAHKERFKQLRALVDILTMTATPIPRTMHMALLGLRDISNLTTPPQGRAPIRTEIIRFDSGRIKKILLRELDRDGQVYFVHNRVKTLKRVQDRLAQIVPEARFGMAHGQMGEKELFQAMQAFLNREIDVLVTTTIIESGLDIPNVNTIVISDADRYGLADLHQLRGRVGRYRHQAYAYFMVPENRPMNRDAQRRLHAIEKFSQLGSGFEIALKDLEIRGTGNILGAKQSGHIAQVGYDMYCQLLKKAVGSLKTVKGSRFLPSTVLNLSLPAYLPESFVPAGFDRVAVYRALTGMDSETDLQAEADRLQDRFGALPDPVRRLLDVQRLRIRLKHLNVRSVGREAGHPVVAIIGSLPAGMAEKSAFPMRLLEPGVYVIEKETATDEAAVDCLLAWSGALLPKSRLSRETVT